MTEPTQSSYTKIRKSVNNDEIFQMDDERGGSMTHVLNSGDHAANILNNQQINNTNLLDERFMDEQLSQDGNMNQLNQKQEEIDQNQTANGRQKSDESFDNQKYQDELDSHFYENEINDNHNFTVNNNSQMQDSKQQITKQNNKIHQNDDIDNGDFEIEQLEISFEDDDCDNNLIDKHSTKKQFERPFSNIEEPQISGDIDEGLKINDLINRTPLRDAVKLSQQNKFQNIRHDLFYGNQQQSTNKKINFEQSQNVFQINNNLNQVNFFDHMNDLDQDEIDQILQQNNISPLRNDTLENQNNLNNNQQLNLVSDFNFDFIDNDDDLDQIDILGQNSQQQVIKGQTKPQIEENKNLTDADDELFQELERRRQITQESMKNNNEQQELKIIERSSRKLTNSANGNYESQNSQSQQKQQQQKAGSKQQIGKHISKKSQISNASNKQSGVTKLSFQEYYQTSTNRSVRNKQQQINTNIVKQTSITSSQDSYKDRHQRIAEDKIEGQPTNMKLDIIKKKLNSMKDQRSLESKTQKQASKLPPSINDKVQNSKAVNKKFKFQRLELPETISDTNSDDKIVPFEKEVNQDRKLHNMIPKFNQIQSKINLDQRPSPQRKLQSKPSLINKSKNFNQQINVYQQPKMKQVHSPSINNSINNTIMSRQIEDQQIKDRIALKNHIIQDLRTSSHNNKQNKMNTSVQFQNKISDPYERYKQRALQEQKLKEAPIISQENQDLQNLQQLSTHSMKNSMNKQNFNYEKSLHNLKQFSSMQQFKPFQIKGQIKSVKVIDKTSFDHLREKNQVKEDAKLIKDLQLLENKEKNIKSQIDKIQIQLEKRKKDEEVSNIQVKCLYKNKLDQMRSNESQVQQNIISMKNSKHLYNSQIQNSNEKVKRLSFGGRQNTDQNYSIEINNTNHELKSNRKQSKTPNSKTDHHQSIDNSVGYQQINRINFSKVSINNQSLTPNLEQQQQYQFAHLNQNPSPQVGSKVQIKHIVKQSEEQMNHQRKIEQESSRQSADVSPGYYHISKKPFTGFNLQKQFTQMSTKSNQKIPDFKLTNDIDNEDDEDISQIRNEHGNKSQVRQGKQFFDSEHQNVISGQQESQDKGFNNGITQVSKKVYRPLTAVNKPIATLGNNFIKDLKDQKNESLISESPDKNLRDESSIISNNRIDLSMVAKTNETKYTREELLRIKQRMQTISPQKNTQKSTLEVIQETSLPSYTTLNRDAVKRVSFKEASISDINSQSVINPNFKYNKDVVDMQMNNPNIVNRKSFEQTFNPKKDSHSQSQTQNSSSKHIRNQSVLQSYQDQITKKNKQNQSDQNQQSQVNVDLAYNENMKKKPSIQNKYINSVIENKCQSTKHSILKSSTIDPPPVSQDQINSQNQKKISNLTLNETLKVKINQEEEKDTQREKHNETIQTIRSRENRSLDKSGIDFITEARDFQNIISNLKNLLHKGKSNQLQNNMHSTKSFMTLEQRASSKMSSINHSYITSQNPNNQHLNASMMNNQQQMLERNHFMNQKRSISSQSAIQQNGFSYNQDNNDRRLTQNYPTRTHEPQIIVTRASIPDNQNQEDLNKSYMSSKMYEEKRKKDFDLKLKRDVKALESILTRKHQEMRQQHQNNQESLHNQSMITHNGTHQRMGSLTQSLFDQQRQSIGSSRSTSVQRPSTTKMTGLMTFGQNHQNQTHQQQLTPRGQSFSHNNRKSFGVISNFMPQGNMGTLLQSIKEAEEQLEQLKGESNQIEQQIQDMRQLRQQPI